MKHLSSCSAFALVIAAATAGAAAAQTPPEPDQASQLDEIVVTAQRRGENLQEVPIAVTAVTAERMDAIGISDSRDLAVVTPGLQAPTQAGYFQPRIRGIGTTSLGPGLENPVAVYVDGVYIASAAASLFSYSGIERIEVLKGPQGTLFGRNSTGGLIQVITRDPKPTLGGRASLTYANYDTATGDVYVTGGGERAAIDFGVRYEHQGEGYGVNRATGSETNIVDEDLALRSKLILWPTETLTMRLSADYAYSDGSYPDIRTYDKEPAAGFPNPPAGPYNTNNNVETQRSSRAGGVSLRADQKLGAFDIVSISAYRRSKFKSMFDLDRTPAPGAFIDNTQRDEQFSQEVQIVSNQDGPLKWLAGGYYFWAKSEFDPSLIYTPGIFPIGGVPTFIPVVRGTNIGEQTTQSASAFGQATYAISPSLNFTAGLRYTSEDRSVDTSTVRTRNSDGLLLSSVQFENSARFEKLTWRFALDYKFTPDILGYVSYNRGFKSGGFNVTTPDVKTPYAPETLDAYETGIKAELFDRRFRINPSFFYYDYQNIQVAFFPGAFGGTIGITNGPTATVYGLDLDFEVALVDGLTLFGGASFIHDRFGDFPGAIYNIPKVGGGNTSGTAASFGLNAEGNRLPFTSDFTGNIGLDYRRDAFGGEVSANTNLFFNDGYFPEVDNRRRVDSYYQVSASVGWTSPGGVNIRVWGKNLNDEAVVTQFGSLAGGVGISYQPPRTYGVTLGTKF